VRDRLIAIVQLPCELRCPQLRHRLADPRPLDPEQLGDLSAAQ